MDNKKIGVFISELRKSRNMTQKELAEKLNVTDKAVSKWERGAGYPEITILPCLADVLGVTTGELLLGERAEAEKETQNEDAEPIVRRTVEYAAQSHTQKRKNGKLIAFYSVSIAFLIAAGICLLCNYVSRHALDWSLYVLGSEAVAWLTAAPLLLLEKHRCVSSLAVLTVLSVPLLLLVKNLCPSPQLIFPFVLPITAISLCCLWLFLPLIRLKIRIGYRVALILFLYGVAANYIFNSFISGYLHSGDSVSNLVIEASFALAAIIVAAVTSYKKHYVRES